MPADRPPCGLHVAIDRGQGPVYVLLHGINSTGHDWEPWSPRWASIAAAG